MAGAADKLCGREGTGPLMTRLPLFGMKIRVAGFGGPRLGEQNAFRAIDVFFDSQAKAASVRLTHQGRKAATDSTRPSRSSIARTSANVAGGLARESAIR